MPTQEESMQHDPVSAVASWVWETDTSGEMPQPPAALPIGTAPVRSGEKFGPCLLLLPQGEANFPDFAPWEVGAWDGEDWWILDSGGIVHPTHFCPRPEMPASAPDTASAS
jgi:hypothetical protein